MSTLLLVRDAQVHAPEPLGRRDILIGAGRILAMAERLEPGVPVTVLDAQGAIACPGYVDSLVHLSGGGGEGGFATRTSALNPADAIAAGVTTLIGALGTDDVTRSHADLLAAARALSLHGLSGYMLTGSYRVPARTLTGSVRDDLILVPDIIGVGEVAIADHRGSHPSVDELARLAADARVGAMLAGKRGTVLVHVGDGDDALDLLHAVLDRHPLPAGQFHPTHLNRSARLLQRARAWIERGGSVDLTASTTPALIAAGDIPAARALAQLLVEGLPASRISMSSDAQGSLPHFDTQGRLLQMAAAPVSSLHASVCSAVLEHGVPLREALAVVTASPAAIWGLERKGRLRPGCDADVLLLDPDSLGLRATIASGLVHRRQGEAGRAIG